MKKIISIFIAAVLIISNNFVFAGEDLQIDHNITVGENIVTVSGTAYDAAGLPITFKIESASGGLMHIEQVILGDDGSFSFEVKELAEEASYTYSLRHLRMKEPASVNFYIGSENEKEEVLKSFNELDVGVTAEDRIGTMTEFLTNPKNAVVLNLDIEAFNALKDKTAVIKGMCDEYKSLKTIEQISEKFNGLVKAQAEEEEKYNQKEKLIKSIVSAEPGEMLKLIEKNAEVLEIKTEYGFKSIKNAYEDGNEALAENLKNAVKDAKTPTEFQIAFANAVVLVAFNEESWGKFDEIAELYSEYIGNIFEDAKESLTDIEFAELKKEMQSEEFDSINDVKNFIEEKTEEMIDSRKSSGGGSGGGGGGKSKAVEFSGAPTVSKYLPAAPVFTDCEHVLWAKESIIRLKEKGIVNGKSETFFSPDDETKREEFLKMLICAMDLETESDAETAFEDVSKDAWYAPYISASVKLGIVTGISETEFGIGRKITRQDMAVLCFRALEVIKKQPTVSGEYEFSDNDSISEYAKDAVSAMQSAGIIKGMDDNRFEPLFFATRAQTAVIIDRLMALK